MASRAAGTLGAAGVAVAGRQLRARSLRLTIARSAGAQLGAAAKLAAPRAHPVSRTVASSPTRSLETRAFASLSAADVIRPRPTLTHDVLNQSSEYADYNAFTVDRGLVEAVSRGGGDWGAEHLTTFGARVGSAEVMAWADQANTHGPKFRPYSKHGEHINSVEFHPAYHSLMSLAIESRVPSWAWVNSGKPGAHVIRGALGYLQYQAEFGVSCPMSMAFACVPALRQTPSVAEDWVPWVTSGKYDARDIPPHDKAGVVLGMSMTEKQGGSDVRANTTVATPLGDPGSGQQYSLKGHKWFTSAPMSDAFLTLAHTEEGVSCFLVPRWLPDGSRNVGFRIMRLKDKVGDRANASSEVEYDNAWGVMVGQPGKGIHTILDMVVHTRLDCTLGSASLIRQAVGKAVHHAGGRAAFGAKLIDQPAMRGVLADLCAESEAATITALRLARAFDDAERDGEQSEANAFRRIATAVAKYWVCKRAPNVAYEAMECHGGNGYAEDWPMARIFRQSPLNSIWEGSGNVICLDVLRAAAKEPESLQAFADFLLAARGADARLDRLINGLTRSLTDGTLRDPVGAQAAARHLVDRMAVALQATLLVTEGNADAAELFCAARIGREGTWNYGALDPVPADEVQGQQEMLARIIDRFV